MKRNYTQLLQNRWALGNCICVGLDPVWEKIPQHLRRSNAEASSSTLSRVLFQFCADIVNRTHHLACAFKPNSAFFEAHGEAGEEALLNIVQHIKRVAPDVPIIYDAKRIDIGNTNEGYAKKAFNILEADAITVNPYLGGGKTLEPFLRHKDKGIIILCRTSNPEAGEIQDLIVSDGTYSNLPLYQVVANKVAMEWNTNENCSVVVGATNPKQLKEVRRIVGNMPILIPGLGAQGGDMEATIEAGKDFEGKGMVINASRTILYASPNEDYAEAAGIEMERMNDAVKMCLKK